MPLLVAFDCGVFCGAVGATMLWYAIQSTPSKGHCLRPSAKL
jgi:hypothetical protein